MGEIQSALTTEHKQLMCLDASKGMPGQHLYTNFCMMGMNYTGHPQPISRQEDIGQIWRWNTSGAAGFLTHSSSGNCAGTVSGNASVALVRCDASNRRRWLFPKSGRLTPPAPPRSATAATSTASSVRARAGSGDDPARMEVARPADASDPYLRHWNKTMPGPVSFAGVPCSFPSRIWASDQGDYWNVLCDIDGRSPWARYVSTTPSFMNWTLADRVFTRPVGLGGYDSTFTGIMYLPRGMNVSVRSLNFPLILDL